MKTGTLGFLVFPDLVGIVALSIVGNNESAIVGSHRLMPLRRKIDDAQPSTGEADRSANIHTPVIRSSVSEGLGHTFEQIRFTSASNRR